MVRVTELFAERGVRPYDELGVLRSRSVMERVIRLQKDPIDVASVAETLVPGPAGVLPARVYDPDPGRPLPLVVYLHGGGWVTGGVGVADRPCRRLALAGECVVVAVEYRLAPETKFPGPFQDCLAAVRWLARHGAELGGDGSQLVVMGDSAGGNLAAAVALDLGGQSGVAIGRQILVYPCLAPARDSPFQSMSERADGPLITRAELTWFWAQYLGSPADETDPRAVPLAADDLSGAPPATIVLAELDPLRDEGLAYADRLRRVGVEVETTVYPGAAHGFWWMDAMMRQADELTEQLGRLLRAR